MHFSYALQISKIKQNKLPENYECILGKLNSLSGKEGFFYREYTEEGEGNRNYFWEENAKKIDAICIFLDKELKSGNISEDDFYYYKASLIDAVTRVSNTSGTYGSFLKINDNRKYKNIIFSIIGILVVSLTTNNNK